MRIAKDSGQKVRNEIDLRDLYIKLLDEHRNVFIYKLDDEIYFFRSIKRNEYKKIFLDDSFNDFERQDMVCETCILYPEGFNAEDQDAGLPTKLCDIILRNSLMDSFVTQANALQLYRSEMAKLSDQINCLIAEAYPKYSIEEIENWDMDQTLKFLSRAEWTLVNLRNIPIDPNYFNFSQVNSSEVETEEEKEKPAEKPKKQKLTPEKLAELKRKMPEIDWEHDSVMMEGERALEVEVDTTPPALRPGW